MLLLLLHLGALAALVQADAASNEPTVEMEAPRLQAVLLAPERLNTQPPAANKVPELAKTEPKPVSKPPQAKPRPAHPPIRTAKKATPAALPTPNPDKVVSQPVSVRSHNIAEPVIQAPSADAAGLNNKAPIYPMLSRKRKEQGTVYLLLLVSKEGKVTQLKLKKTSGFNRLDQAALHAVKHWKFQPARQQGEPVDYWYELPLKFSLQQG